VLAVHGTKVDLFGRHPQKLAIARKAGVRTPARRRTQSYPFLIDATGSAAGFAEALALVQPRGVLVMKSTVHERITLDLAPIIVNEITLLGSRCGRFGPALDLLTARKLNLDPMISAEYPLTRAPEAFARAQGKGALKVLLRPA
jgi:alcohol dehydrogenase